MTSVLLAAIATLIAASVQAATGLGFALILGPMLFAVLEPSEAVTTLLLLGIAVSLLVLFAEGRRDREVRRHDLVPLLVAAVPGVFAGVLVLDALSKPALQVGIGVVVLAAALVQVMGDRPRPGTRPAGGRRRGAAIGLGTGALTTTTGVNGPPISLWLLSRGASAAELRDSLAVAFLVLNAAGWAAVVLLADGAGRADPLLLLVLLPVCVVGHFAGRKVFEQLADRKVRVLTLALVVIAGVASIAAGLTG